MEIGWLDIKAYRRNHAVIALVLPLLVYAPAVNSQSTSAKNSEEEQNISEFLVDPANPFGDQDSNDNNNDQMNVDEDDNESSSLGSINDEMEDEQQQEDTEMSPSPNKKKHL